MNTGARSFLENFGLRAFGGWSRPVRPGMENGMFAYDESTAELFDVEDPYAQVGVELIGDAAEMAAIPEGPTPILRIRVRPSIDDPTAWVIEPQPIPEAGKKIPEWIRGLVEKRSFH